MNEYEKKRAEMIWKNWDNDQNPLSIKEARKHLKNKSNGKTSTELLRGQKNET